MNQVVDLDRLTQATRRREFDDGLADFAAGAVILALGLLDWLLFSTAGLAWYATALAKHRALTLAGLLALMLLVVVGAWGARRAIGRIRMSENWRRRGIVRPLRRQIGWPTALAAALTVGGMLAGAATMLANGRIDQDGVLRTLVAAAGVGTGAVYLGIGVSLRIRRYLVVGPAGGVLSALILFSTLSFSAAWLVLGAIWGSLLGASGAWALRQSMASSSESNDG